uniref:Putative secreted protein n=1 Tax=Ixodes ricinus TaxID=34613 RepID=A0A147BSE1_IXORI
MEATKLLLFLAFHVGAADSSGDEISNQETRLFFDRALQAAVVGYDLDPLEFPGFEFEVSVAVAKVKLYNITVYGLGTVCGAGENFISADNNGTCLKIDVAVRNVTVSVRANVTVGLFLFTSTVMMETIVLVNFTEVTLDIQDKNATSSRSSSTDGKWNSGVRPYNTDVNNMRPGDRRHSVELVAASPHGASRFRHRRTNAPTAVNLVLLF